MHNNRCGDIDPYIIFYLVESCGMTLEEVKQMLQTRSGLYGMSGGAGCDLRDVQAAAEAGNEDAELAIRAYCYSIKKYIGAYAAVMGGLDAIVFGGGIGLNSPLVRALSLEGLEFLGVRLDGFKNRMAIAGMDISMEDAPRPRLHRPYRRGDHRRPKGGGTVGYTLINNFIRELFPAALGFFEETWDRGESFFDFMYLYK